MRKIALVLVLVCLFAANSYAINSSLQFDNTGDCITISDHDNWDIGGSLSSNRTIDLWVNLSSFENQGWPNVLIGQYDDINYFWDISIDYSGTPRFFLKNVSTNAYCYGSAAITTNTYHHIALVKQGPSYRLYLDGVDVAYSTQKAPLTFSQPLKISRSTDFQDLLHLNGKMDEIRFWDFAMTQEEVNYWKQYSITGNEFGLLARWGFDEGSGNVAYDSSPYGNNGQTVGASWSTAGAPIQPIPEPSTVVLLGVGLLGKVLFRRKIAKK